MLTLIDKSVRVQAVTGTTSMRECPELVYDAWIKRVHHNRTPVDAGDTYVWLFVQLLPPRLVNCIVTVRLGDDYPPGS